jgi:hypothetical protein
VFHLDLPAPEDPQREARLEFLGTVTDDAQVRRSVRIEDMLYSISNNSVTVHPILDPKTLLAQLHFGQEDVGVPVFTANRELDVIRAAIETPELVSPLVIDVFAGSTQWDPRFVNHLEAEGMVSVATDPMAVLPLVGADQIKVKFSEDVLVGFGDLTMTGQNQGPYSFIDFAYDAGTSTATWTLAAPIDADNIKLTLRTTNGSVTDDAGNALDGDANGSAGGSFSTQFDVLPGDVDRDGRVDGADLALARIHLDSDLGAPDYSLEFDIDGSGRIDSTDLAEIEKRFGTSVPDFVPPITGDANRDGRFDSADLIHVLSRGRYRTSEFATWEEGDWNRDGLFDEGDLIRAFQDGHYIDPAAAHATDAAFQSLVD